MCHLRTGCHGGQPAAGGVWREGNHTMKGTGRAILFELPVYFEMFCLSDFARV